MKRALLYRKWASAFSLVEVAMALGVVSIGLIPLLGLLPIGLNQEREAMFQTSRSHILSQISADLGMLKGGDSDHYFSAAQFYDDRGERLPDGAEGAVYEVKLTPVEAEYPGSGVPDAPSARLKSVHVEIRYPGIREAYRFTFSYFDASRPS